jgi:nucleotide-binding universal stress UspA family protein
MVPIQTILHPTDFSESAKHALRLACCLARDQEARLVVLHVVPPGLPIVSSMMMPAPPVSVEESDTDAQQQLQDKIEMMMPACKALPVEYRVEEGAVVDRILAVAAEEDAGLIVLGTHGRTGLGRVFMGSVAEEVVRKAPSSVLAVKTPVSHEPASHVVEEERPVLATPY